MKHWQAETLSTRHHCQTRPLPLRIVPQGGEWVAVVKKDLPLFVRESTDLQLSSSLTKTNNRVMYRSETPSHGKISQPATPHLKKGCLCSPFGKFLKELPGRRGKAECLSLLTGHSDHLNYIALDEFCMIGFMGLYRAKLRLWWMIMDGW